MKRKYFIGFALPPQLANYANKISKKLAETYALKDVLKKYPPHITLKIPFEATDEQLKALINYLQRFCLGRKLIPIALEGFGHFNVGVIYWDVLLESAALNRYAARNL